MMEYYCENCGSVGSNKDFCMDCWSPNVYLLGDGDGKERHEETEHDMEKEY